MYNYTYYVYEEFGRGYIGSRGSPVPPEQDIKYMGSSEDKTFKPTQKIILGTNNTRQEAYDDEILIQRFFKVVENPHFANLSYQTSNKFCTSKEDSIKNGKLGGKISYELGLGFHALSKEQLIENGKRTHQLGLGVHALSKEQTIENARLGGLKSVELGLGLHGLSKEQIIENAKLGARIAAEKLSIEFILVSPAGQIYRGRNIREFCRTHNLDRFSIHNVIRGKRKRHRGWTRYVKSSASLLPFL